MSGSASSSKAKNTATPEDIYKFLRGHHLRLEPSKYLTCDLEDVVINHVEFICDALQVTSRLNVSLLAAAALKAYDRISLTEAQAWARQIAAAVSNMRTKAKNMTSGEKYHPAIRRVCLLIRNGADVEITSGVSKSETTTRPDFLKICCCHCVLVVFMFVLRTGTTRRTSFSSISDTQRSCLLT